MGQGLDRDEEEVELLTQKMKMMGLEERNELMRQNFMHSNGGITEEVRMMVEHGVISPEDAMRMIQGEE